MNLYQINQGANTNQKGLHYGRPDLQEDTPLCAAHGVGQTEPQPRPPGPRVREEANTRHPAPGAGGRGQGERLQAPVPGVK